MATSSLLFCQCRYADVIPQDTRDAAFASITHQNVDCTVVPDLCECAVHQKDLLQEVCDQTDLCVVACYPRAVSALLTAAEVNVDPCAIRWINMRELSPGDVTKRLSDELGTSS